MKSPSAYRLLAFDLDGTLTVNHTPIDDDNLHLLSALAKKYDLLILSAASCQRIYRQTRHFPAATFIGNYGLQEGQVNMYGEFIFSEKTAKKVDTAAVNAFFDGIRKKFGYTAYRGDSVLFAPTGLISFPLLGTTAEVAEKQRFDPDGAKRGALLPDIKAAFPEETVVVTGTNSIDIIPHPHSKLTALRAFCAKKGYSDEQVLFCGDEYHEGGNDAEVYHSGIDFVPVDDPHLLPLLLAPLL